MNASLRTKPGKRNAGVVYIVYGVEKTPDGSILAISPGAFASQEAAVSSMKKRGLDKGASHGLRGSMIKGCMEGDMSLFYRGDAGNYQLRLWVEVANIEK